MTTAERIALIRRAESGRATLDDAVPYSPEWYLIKWFMPSADEPTPVKTDAEIIAEHAASKPQRLGNYIRENATVADVLAHATPDEFDAWMRSTERQRADEAATASARIERNRQSLIVARAALALKRAQKKEKSDE